MKKIVVLLLLITSSIFLTFGQDYARPVRGEGIHAFLKRHNRSESEYYQKFVELNQSKLGKGRSLKQGVSYRLPPLVKTNPAKQIASVKQTNPVKQTTLKTGLEPLFGEKFAQYEIVSDRLKGACFFLVSGHGGPDPGAVAKVGNIELHEDEYAYDIMLRLALNLLKEGATVHIITQDAKDGIRDDKYLSNTNDRETYMGEKIHQGYKEKDALLRLKQQSDKVNSLSKKSRAKYQRAVFIHLDSRSSNDPLHRKSIDMYFYYWTGSVKGKQLANTLKETISASYKKVQPEREDYKGPTKERDLYVLRNIKPVAVFAELGNIQNEGRDRQRILDSNNRQAIANWLRDGLIKDYNDNK